MIAAVAAGIVGDPPRVLIAGVSAIFGGKWGSLR